MGRTTRANDRTKRLAFWKDVCIIIAGIASLELGVVMIAGYVHEQRESEIEADFFNSAEYKKLNWEDRQIAAMFPHYRQARKQAK